MKPANEMELSEAIRGANGPLRIVGGGTRAIGPDRAGEVLETGALSGISLYEPGALTIVAGAGTPLAEVEAALDGGGQRLPFEVPDLRGLLGRSGASTIGGVVAANGSGPRRIQAGACRDSLIGVRFVDGAGTIVKNGGRVMKNVTGYDLVKLMAGSHGTLGVLTEVAFKVLPRPEVEATLTRDGVDPAAAVAAMAQALGSPYEVTGAAYFGGQIRLRIEGMIGSVAYRSGALRKLLGAGWDVVEAAQSAILWREIRDVAPFMGQAGAVWRISIKPSDMPQVLAVLSQAQTLCDWGGGLIWALVPDAGDAQAGALRGALAAMGGHATLVRAGAAVYDTTPAFHPEPAALATLSKTLRAKFDPRGILNPGMMG
ncbi:glycolate oxidase subunit GlcE [Pseudorhodobacter ferrugineus]|uniref:glycolate oxidase subunit GlcE n=1 Tax=Pseudorhodobacter ferrugineus TaxID=77008 RepID=UPI0003B3EDC6|nr:glycolate oxidase subunit GlcE [Pseudorhodobacter ferrugineus]